MLKDEIEKNKYSIKIKRKKKQSESIKLDLLNS